MNTIVRSVVAAITKMTQPVIKEAYEGFKKLLGRKYAQKPNVLEAMDLLEADPDSAGRQAVLEEELTKVGAGEDKELVEAAEALYQTVVKISGEATNEGSIQQTVTGNRNIVIGQAGSINMGMPKDED